MFSGCSECVIRLSDLIGMADGSIQSLSLSLANLIGLRAADVEGLTNISSVSNDVAVSACALCKDTCNAHSIQVMCSTNENYSYK